MLPIALRPGSRRAVIVGGGNVALRKAESLFDAGLRLFVVAPEIDVRLRTVIEHIGGTFAEREYEMSDLIEAMIVVVATNNLGVNARVKSDAHAMNVLICDAVTPENGDFTMLATVRVGELTFTVDSGRSTPAFSARLARELRERFDERYDVAARILAKMRKYAQTTLSEEQRHDVMRALAELPIEELAAMNPADAEHEVESALAHLHTGLKTPRTATVICASRASTLAMTQTKLIASRLAERGVASTILNITTSGDRIQDRPIAEIGGVSVFVKELEQALRDRRADYAVHSCKDLPSEIPKDMKIAAISSREDPRDAFCSERYASFEGLPTGAVVGTSSPRRRWQLHALRPDLVFKDIRGNVDTRLRKLREGEYDAIVLAMAGLNRLHLQATHTVAFPIDVVVPAVAQGALAVETRAEDRDLSAQLYDAINDERIELAVGCERAALRALDAGCDTPIGVHARFDEHDLIVDAAYAVPNGNVVLREHARSQVMTLEGAIALGSHVGKQLLGKIEGHNGTAQSLHGRLVVLPRTQERPSRIAAALRARGADVIEIQSGEAGPDPLERPADMLLFPSSGSVVAAAGYLDMLRATERRPRVAAMGPQSAEAARQVGFDPDDISPEATIEAFVGLVLEQLQRT